MKKYYFLLLLVSGTIEAMQKPGPPSSGHKLSLDSKNFENLFEGDLEEFLNDAEKQIQLSQAEKSVVSRFSARHTKRPTNEDLASLLEAGVLPCPTTFADNFYFYPETVQFEVNGWNGEILGIFYRVTMDPKLGLKQAPFCVAGHSWNEGGYPNNFRVMLGYLLTNQDPLPGTVRTILKKHQEAFPELAKRAQEALTQLEGDKATL